VQDWESGAFQAAGSSSPKKPAAHFQKSHDFRRTTMINPNEKCLSRRAISGNTNVRRMGGIERF
jgi:hypothetical protein